MDFLKIRKKAKERAAAGGLPPAAAPTGSEPPARPGPPVEPRREQAGAPGGADGGTPGEALQGASAPPADRAADPRFTTWRPGAGERPFAGFPDPVPFPPRPDPGAEAIASAARAPEAGARVLPTAADWGTTAYDAGAQRDPLDEFFFREDERVPALAALPADAPPATAAVDDAGVEEYLTFRLGVEEYAVAIERVREVLKAPPITEVPRAPAGILGVITVRGEVVTVFDPRRRLSLPGGPPPDGSGRIVIVDDGDGPCGLLVDGVASVVRLARGSIEPCPQGIGGASADCLAGIGRERSRLFTVLDLGALLRPVPARGRAAHAGA